MVGEVRQSVEWAKNGGSLTVFRPYDRIPRALGPHRLVAQDGALSRLKQGFESPWGHRFTKDRQQIMLSGFCLYQDLIQEKN